MRVQKHDHDKKMKAVFKENPAETMEYYRSKMQCIRTTGTIQPNKKPNSKQEQKDKEMKEKAEQNKKNWTVN